MLIQTTPLPDSEIQRRIQVALSWDLSKPKEFLVLRQEMNPNFVDRMEKEYRRYIACVATNPSDKLPISNAVDELWHAHILFTKDYAKMSKALKGAYIDHIPTLSEEERAALEPFYFDVTLERYRQVFKEDPPQEFWPSESGSICWSCT